MAELKQIPTLLLLLLPLLAATTVTPEIIIEANLDEVAGLLTKDIHNDDPEIVVHALKRLSNELFDSTNCQQAADHRAQATKMGAVTLVVIVMRKWKNNPKIQKWACDFLAMILLDDNNEANHVFPLVDAMEAVVKAMHQFPSIEDVQEAGLFALGNALDLDSKDKGIQASSQNFVEGYDIATGSGIELVIKAVKLFPANQDVQARGIVLLTNVFNKKYRRQYLEAGSVSAVSTSLENHLEHAELEEIINLFMELMFPGKRKRK